MNSSTDSNAVPPSFVFSGPACPLCVSFSAYILLSASATVRDFLYFPNIVCVFLYLSDPVCVYFYCDPVCLCLFYSDPFCLCIFLVSDLICQIFSVPVCKFISDLFMCFFIFRPNVKYFISDPFVCVCVCVCFASALQTDSYYFSPACLCRHLSFLCPFCCVCSALFLCLITCIVQLCPLNSLPAPPDRLRCSTLHI